MTIMGSINLALFSPVQVTAPTSPPTHYVRRDMQHPESFRSEQQYEIQLDPTTCANIPHATFKGSWVTLPGSHDSRCENARRIYSLLGNSEDQGYHGMSCVTRALQSLGILLRSDSISLRRRNVLEQRPRCSVSIGFTVMPYSSVPSC